MPVDLTPLWVVGCTLPLLLAAMCLAIGSAIRNAPPVGARTTGDLLRIWLFTPLALIGGYGLLLLAVFGWVLLRRP